MKQNTEWWLSVALLYDRRADFRWINCIKIGKFNIVLREGSKILGDD